MSDQPAPPRLTLIRIVAFLGLFGTALLLAGTVVFALAERGRLLADATTQARSTAAYLADHAARLFEAADVALAATTAELGERDWDTLAQSRDLYIHMKAVSQALPYISNIWLNDADGRLRLTSLAFPSPASDAKDRLSFKQIQAPASGLVVGEPITAKLTGERTFLVARRLSWPDGGFRGMVSATADLAYYVDYWGRLDIPYGAQVALRRTGLGETFVEFPASPRAHSASDIVAAVAVGDVPLSLEVAIPRAAVLAAWDRWLATYLPLALVAALALLALTALAVRQGRRETASANALRDARAALARVNAGLEATVATRTAELRESTEEVRQFAYLVSHDLRGPLLNVAGFAGELAALRPSLFPPDDPARQGLAREFDEMLAFIRSGSLNMDRLLGHILALSREGRRRLDPEMLDMTALMRSLVDGQRFQLGQTGAAIEVAELPGVVADRLAVEQIFGNLLDNAVKYRDPERPCRVAVTGRIEGDQVIIEVSDNGRGIASADQARVFELFRRVGSPEVKGEGIGLAFVRTLARALGGRVDLESERNVGSVFRVTLPARPVEA